MFVRTWLAQIACVAIGCTALACTTTFQTRDGRELRGEVTRSYADTVEVQLTDGEIVELRRDEIDEVDHAGTGGVIAGGVMLGLALTGLVATGIGIAHDANASDESYVGLGMAMFVGVPSVLLAVFGGVTLAGGIGTRNESIERYEYDPSAGDVELTVAPWGDLDGEGRPSGGVGLSVRY